MPRLWSLVLVVLSVWVAASVSAGAQRLAMMRAEWNDLARWSTYDEGSRETELGLGLVVPGPQGETRVAFTGRLSVRAPKVPPRQIGVQVGLGKFTNPYVVRRPSLVFAVDAGERSATKIDLSERLNVDDPTPGGSVENATAMFPVADFVRLASAKKVVADVLGFESQLRDDQIAAVRRFAESLHAIPPEGASR